MVCGVLPTLQRTCPWVVPRVPENSTSICVCAGVGTVGHVLPVCRQPAGCVTQGLKQADKQAGGVRYQAALQTFNQRGQRCKHSINVISAMYTAGGQALLTEVCACSATSVNPPS